MEGESVGPPAGAVKSFPGEGDPYWPSPPRVGLYRQISYVLHMPIAILLGMPRDISRQ